MSDQFGNTVDKEIRVPVKGWQPLGKNSWIEDADYVPVEGFIQYVEYTPKDGSTKPRVEVEYTIAKADGTLVEGTYPTEGDGRRRLAAIRKELKFYAVPEEYWPILMEREIYTAISVDVGSWRILDV